MRAGWLERRAVKRRLSLGSLRSAQQQPVIWTQHWAEIRDGVLLLFPARPKDEAAAAIALPEAAIRLEGRKAQPFGAPGMGSTAASAHCDICMELLPAPAHGIATKKSSRSKAAQQRQIFRFPPGAALGEWLRALIHAGVVSSDMEWEESLGALPAGFGADSEPAAAAAAPSQDRDRDQGLDSDAAATRRDDIPRTQRVGSDSGSDSGSGSDSDSDSGSGSGSGSDSDSDSSTGSDSDSIAESNSRTHVETPASFALETAGDAAARACSTAAAIAENAFAAAAVAGPAPPRPPRVEPTATGTSARRKPSYQTGLVGSYFAAQRQDVPTAPDAGAGGLTEVGVGASADAAAAPRSSDVPAPAGMHASRAHAAAAGPLARRAQQLGRRRRASASQKRSASMFVGRRLSLSTAAASTYTLGEGGGASETDGCRDDEAGEAPSALPSAGAAGPTGSTRVDAATGHQRRSSLAPAGSQQNEAGKHRPMQMAQSARRFTDSVAFNEQGNLLDFIAAGRTEWRVEKVAAKSGKRQRRMLGVDLWQVTRSSNKGVSGLGAAITKRRRHVVLCAVADVLQISAGEQHNACVVLLKYLPPMALLTGARAVSEHNSMAGSSVAARDVGHAGTDDARSERSGEHAVSYRFCAQSPADGAEIVGKIRHLMGIHQDLAKLSRLAAYFPRPVAFPAPKAPNEGEA